MADFDAGSIIGRIKADLTDFKNGMSQAKSAATDGFTAIGKSIDDANAKAADFKKGLQSLAVGLGAIAAGGTLAMKGWITDAEEQQKVLTQLNAVLASTQNAAGLTAPEITKMALEMSKKTAVEKDAIITGQNMLLTYSNIKENAFKPATQAVIDMATAMSGGAIPNAEAMRSTAEQLGKALNDPITGMTRLQRVGVTFSDQQKEQIKTMMEANNVLGAQNVILGQVAEKFGGSATAQAKTYAGATAQLANAQKELNENLGNALMNILTPLINLMDQVVSAVADWTSAHPVLTEVIAGTVAAVTALAAIGATVAGVMLAWPGILAGVAVAVVATGTVIDAMTGPIGWVIGAISLLAAAFATNFLGIRDKTMAVVQDIAKFWQWEFNVLKPVFQWIAEVGVAAAKAIFDSWNNYINATGKLGYAFFSAIGQKGIADDIETYTKKMNISVTDVGAVFAAIGGKIKSVVGGITSDVTSMTGATASAYDASTGSASAASKKLDDLRTKGLQTAVDFNVKVKSTLDELTAAHTTAMIDFGNKISDLKDQISSVKEAYTSDMADIATATKAAIAKVKLELSNQTLKLDIDLQTQTSQIKGDTNTSIAEKYVAEQDQLAADKKALASATSQNEVDTLKAQIAQEEATLATDSQYVIGLEDDVAAARKRAGETDIQRLLEDEKTKIAAAQADHDRQVADAAASEATQIADLKTKEKNDDAARTKTYEKDMGELDKKLRDTMTSMANEITLYDKKEKEITKLRDQSVKAYGTQLEQMNELTSKQINSMINKFQALNAAIAGIGKSKNLSYLNVAIGSGIDTSGIGNVAATLPALDNPLAGLSADDLSSLNTANQAAQAAGMGTTTINVTVNGSVTSEQAATDMLKAAFGNILPSLVSAR